jgi:hypothetical protein
LILPRESKVWQIPLPHLSQPHGYEIFKLPAPVSSPLLSPGRPLRHAISVNVPIKKLDSRRRRRKVFKAVHAQPQQVIKIPGEIPGVGMKLAYTDPEVLL